MRTSVIGLNTPWKASLPNLGGKSEPKSAAAPNAIPGHGRGCKAASMRRRRQACGWRRLRWTGRCDMSFSKNVTITQQNWNSGFFFYLSRCVDHGPSGRGINTLPLLRWLQLVTTLLPHPAIGLRGQQMRANVIELNTPWKKRPSQIWGGKANQKVPTAMRLSRPQLHPTPSQDTGVVARRQACAAVAKRAVGVG